jgi:hypothetical protein
MDRQEALSGGPAERLTAINPALSVVEHFPDHSSATATFFFLLSLTRYLATWPYLGHSTTHATRTRQTGNSLTQIPLWILGIA